ncbi:protocadherin gamma-A10-like [Vombatus ursinus]|nr:protocadherin gamma-A10-like [Vombatus ursinus]
MGARQRLRDCKGQVLLCFLLGTLWEAGSGQIRYSVPEEMDKGSFVGDLSKDLGLEPQELSERGARIVSGGKKQHFTLNLQNGHLYVSEKIDRESMCGQISQCLMTLQVLMEEPVKLVHAEVEILDINDNSPTFPVEEILLEIREITTPGARFHLQDAQDPDIGNNSLQNYLLGRSTHFSLNVQTKAGGTKYAELVLEKALDREEQAEHQLLLIATDGGDPARTGETQIRIRVLDVNDNAPRFQRSLYEVSVPEDVQTGTAVVKVQATDRDEGSNAEITYSLIKLSEASSLLFQIGPTSGELKIVGSLDFEADQLHELEVQAIDGGGLSALAHILLRVTDVNDNPPEITITSLFSPVPEDSPLGTIIALFNVHDRDSAENGRIRCAISRQVPFEISSSFDNYYSLISIEILDRERILGYNITITAEDRGDPPLTSYQVIQLQVSDKNDNPPVFHQSHYLAYVMENNLPGATISSPKASDADSEDNARVTYSIANETFQGSPLSSYISINSETGVLYALRSFDYEQFRQLQLRVTARDSGDPPLSSNVTLTLFILDQNDNAPEILYPAFPTDGSSGVELAPRAAEPGYLVTKVVAVDGDSGQNAWLSYRLLKSTEPGLFSVGLHTGEITTTRAFLGKDSIKQTLVVAVTDNGEPPLSATISITVAVADSIPEILSDLSNLMTPEFPNDSNLTFYLVIAVAAVSCLFFSFIILLLALRLRRRHMELGSASTHLESVQVSRFLGIDGVQAFLQTYSHEVSSTIDSRKSHLKFSASNSQEFTSKQGSDQRESIMSWDACNKANEEQAFIKRCILSESAPLGAALCSCPARLGSERRATVFHLDDLLRSLNEHIIEESWDSYIRLAAFSHSAPEPKDSPFPEERGLSSLTRNIWELPKPRLKRKRGGDSSAGQREETMRPRERGKDLVVGNLVKDQGLEARDLPALKTRLLSGAEKEYFTVNVENGGLYIRITVVDANDNPLVFSQDVYRVSLQENLPLGSSVLGLMAMDLDEGSPLSSSKTLALYIDEVTTISLFFSNLTMLLTSLRTIPLESAIESISSSDLDLEVECPILSSAATWSSCNCLLVHLSMATVRASFYSSPTMNKQVRTFVTLQAMMQTPLFSAPMLLREISLCTAVTTQDPSGSGLRLAYSEQQDVDPGIFSLELRKGEVSISRALTDRDAAGHRLLVSVQDRGQPCLSTTVCLHLVFADSLQEAPPEMRDQNGKHSDCTNSQNSLLCRFSDEYLLLPAQRRQELIQTLRWNRD